MHKKSGIALVLASLLTGCANQPGGRRKPNARRANRTRCKNAVATCIAHGVASLRAVSPAVSDARYPAREPEALP